MNTMRPLKSSPIAMTVFAALFYFAGMLSTWLMTPMSAEKTKPADSGTGRFTSRKITIRESALDHKHTRLMAIANDPSRHEMERPELNLDELAAIISMIAANVGIEGLDGENRQRIDALLGRMHQLDPAATISWIMSVPNRGNRRIYFRTVLELEAAADPLRALELAESFHRKMGDPILIPQALPEGLVKHGPDVLLRAIALTIGNADEYASLPNTYPSDFDFEAMIDGMAKLASGLDEVESLPFRSNVLLASWLEQDAQAAYDWFVSAPEDQKAVIGGVTGFFDAYAFNALPTDYGIFAAQVTLMGNPTNPSWADATSILMSNYDSSSLNAFLTEAAKYQDSKLIFRNLLEKSNDYSGGSYDNFRRNLFDQAPADIRAEYLRTAPEHVLNAMGVVP